MGTLSNLPLSLPLPLRFHHFSYPQTQISNPILPSRICPNSLRSNGSSKRIVVFGRNSSEPLESQFFDENGAVDNMDGYLNYLSLEYDSVWDTKPSWWAFFLPGFFLFLIYYFIVKFLPCSLSLLSFQGVNHGQLHWLEYQQLAVAGWFFTQFWLQQLCQSLYAPGGTYFCILIQRYLLSFLQIFIILIGRAC